MINIEATLMSDCMYVMRGQERGGSDKQMIDRNVWEFALGL